jgi:hypothetical protein
MQHLKSYEEKRSFRPSDKTFREFYSVKAQAPARAMDELLFQAALKSARSLVVAIDVQMTDEVLIEARDKNFRASIAVDIVDREVRRLAVEVEVAVFFILKLDSVDESLSTVGAGLVDFDVHRVARANFRDRKLVAIAEKIAVRGRDDHAVILND